MSLDAVASPMSGSFQKTCRLSQRCDANEWIGRRLRRSGALLCCSSPDVRVHARPDLPVLASSYGLPVALNRSEWLWRRLQTR